MERSKFHEERKTGIGGSDAAAILGLSKWSSPLDVYMDKVGLKDPEEQNEFMYWGKLLEPLIVKEVEKHFEVEVDLCLEKDGSEKLWSQGISIAHLDGIFLYENDMCLLECKTASPYIYKQQWNEEANQVPYEYFCQVQHYMYVSGLKKCLIAVWVDRSMHYFWIKFHPDFVDEMVKKENEFWEEHVLKENPPPKTTGSDVNQMLDGLKKEPMQASVGLLRLLQRYDELSEEIKHTDEERDSIKADIANEMGDYTIAEYKGEKVASFPVINMVKTDEKKLKDNFPEVYEKCKKTISFRRIWVTLESKSK